MTFSTVMLMVAPTRSHLYCNNENVQTKFFKEWLVKLLECVILCLRVNLKVRTVCDRNKEFK